MPRSRSLTDLVVEVAGLLGVLSLSGLGWAWALGPGDRASRILASVPVGIAVLCVAAITADALGVALAGASSIAVAAGAGLIGGALGLVSELRRRPVRTGSVIPPHPSI